MIRSTAASFFVLTVSALPAVAQDEVEEAPPPASLETVTVLPLGMPPKVVLVGGQFQAELSLITNLSKGSVGKPLSIAPDLFFGVTDRLTLGVVHSSRGLTGFHALPGGSLCVSGEEACGDAYNGGGLEARFLAYERNDFALAPELGLYVLAVDPFTIGLNVATVARVEFGGFFSEFAPQLTIALNERDTDGNEVLSLPLDLGLRSERAAVALQTGLFISLAETDDYTVPLTLYGAYWVTPQVGLQAALSLPTVVTGDAIDVKPLDVRTIQFTVVVRSE